MTVKVLVMWDLKLFYDLAPCDSIELPNESCIREGSSQLYVQMQILVEGLSRFPQTAIVVFFDRVCSKDKIDALELVKTNHKSSSKLFLWFPM